jgi:hypothetical protein
VAAVDRGGPEENCDEVAVDPPIMVTAFLRRVSHAGCLDSVAGERALLDSIETFPRGGFHGGHSAGGEGMEKQFLTSHTPPALNNKIIYADPMDLTKMLDIPPGTLVLQGVRDTQRLFYPSA